MHTKSYFTFGNDTYEIKYAGAVLENVNNEIYLYLEVGPDDNEEEDWGISIEFNTHTCDIVQLKDKQFQWNAAHNEDGESAGYFSTIEEYVQKGMIEILNVTDHFMTIKWSGLFGYGESLSVFDITFEVIIPEKIYYVIDVYKSLEIDIDKNTYLQILNISEFNKELINFSKSMRREKSIIKTKIYHIIKRKYEFHATLKFKLNSDMKDYYGEVVFTEDTSKYVTCFDKGCPRKVNFKYISWNLKNKLERFAFEII